MRKFLTSLGLFAVCAGVFGAPSTGLTGEFAPQINVIDRPGQTLVVRCGLSEAIVFFERRGQLLELTMVLNGGDEMLRTRIQLEDGQGHAMILNSEDGTRRDRFTVRRNGDQILITGTPLGSLKAEL
ncbi:MAG: hypothetical protein AAF317_02950 [Pseudomonadota bacterium]